MRNGYHEIVSPQSLDFRIRAILPEQYQDSYEEVKPVSMGSAALKYGPDGKVAWDDVWGSFCDLAMAGGPPHKGVLLEPGTPDEIAAQADRYQEVTNEICRGINMVTGLNAAAATPGWIQVDCANKAMAGWLVRAITMENVSVRADGKQLFLPAGPHFRVEKEIKNVITSIAKTCHYWDGHMWLAQQREIAYLFDDIEKETPLVQPSLEATAEQVARQIAERIESETGLGRSPHRYSNWLGFTCPDIAEAIWMMRALVVSNVLARREETVLFVPLNPEIDPGGDLVASALLRVHGFSAARG